MSGLWVWVALSSIWSISPSASAREVERMLVYVALALALALVLRRGDAAALAGGVFAGIVSIAAYALGTRLFQDWFETYDDPALPYRLAEPIGYWNALGLLVAMGLLLGVGVVAQSRRWAFSVAAGAALPILVTTLYFTFSRGAWGALVFGLVAMIAIDPRRLRLLFSALVVAPPSVMVVAIASRQEALTHEDAPAAEAVSQGHRLALVLVGLGLASAVLALMARWTSRRVNPPRWVFPAVDGALALTAVGAVVVATVLAGGPRQTIAELEERFDAAPVTGPVTGADLNARLFVLWSNGRAQSIGVAWDAARERPVLGHGAGSYEYIWYEERPYLGVIRDAHSLYAEMLAELGAVGLALLGLALLVPVLGAIHARRHRLVPGAAAAYVAWAIHSAIDWDWEVVGVTLAALLAGGVPLLAAERRSAKILSGNACAALLALSVALAAFALVSLVGNQALFAGREALARGDRSAAREHGRRADALLPWSFEPELVLGDLAAVTGDRGAALAAYRRAVAQDDRNWVIWLRIAQVADGRERAAAYARVRQLNPREPELPGESSDQ
jgi:O-antigen ligase